MESSDVEEIAKAAQSIIRDLRNNCGETGFQLPIKGCSLAKKHLRKLNSVRLLSRKLCDSGKSSAIQAVKINFMGLFGFRRFSPTWIISTLTRSLGLAHGRVFQKP